MIFNHRYQQKRLNAVGMTVSASPNYPVTFEGINKVASFTPTNPDYTWSCVYDSVNDVFYYGVMAITALQRDPWIVKFSKKENRILQVYRIQIGLTPFNADTHRVPNMDVGSDGKLHVVCELLHTTEGHGSSILYYKMGTAGDLTTLTLTQTLTGRWSYPNVLVSGSNVFISARGSTNTGTFIRGQQWYYNSTNGGTSFGSAVKLYQSPDEDIVAYMWLQHDYSGGINIILNERDNVLGNWTFVSFIKGTFNSNVWTNAGGTFSKNVSSSGYITRAEMRSDCMVVDSTDHNTIAVNHAGGCKKSDGTLRVAVVVQTLTGNDFEGNPETEIDEFRIYYFAAGSWTYGNVTIPAGMTVYWAYQHYLLYFNQDGSGDEVIFIDPTNNNNVYIIRSTDNFATQTSTLKLVGNDRWRLGTISRNSTNPRLIVLVDTLGDLFEITAETALDYSNIIALQ